MLSNSTYCFHHNRTGQLPEVQNLVVNTGKTGVSLGACQEYENLEPVLLQEFRNPLRLKMLKVCFLLLSSLLHIDAQALHSHHFWKWDSDVLPFLPSHILSKFSLCWNFMLNPCLSGIKTAFLSLREGCWLPWVGAL